MSTLAITADLDTIADDETLVTYDGALGNIRVQLPTVVSGGGGAAVDLGWATEIQVNGDATLEVLENGATGFRRVAIVEPYSSIVLRSTASVEGPPWIISDWQKEIIATSEDSHIVDLSVTDYTKTAASGTLSSSDTYTQADVEGALDGILDTMADEVDTEAAVAFGEVEAVFDLVLDAMEGASITASS